VRGPKEWDGRLARRIGVCPSKTKNDYDYDYEHDYEHEHEHENGDLVPVPLKRSQRRLIRWRLHFEELGSVPQIWKQVGTL
jgi:hypothetical protein